MVPREGWSFCNDFQRPEKQVSIQKECLGVVSPALEQKFMTLSPNAGNCVNHTGAARRMVILQRFPTARKTSINPERMSRNCFSSFRADFYGTNLPENHALYAEHNSGGTMELVEKLHTVTDLKVLELAEDTNVG